MKNELNRKGIVLAGGKGHRLSPVTNVISKQLLPIYDKPMIYYSLSTLLLMDIYDITIITDKDNISLYQKLLGDGSLWNVNISYIVQERPNGIAEAFLLTETKLKDFYTALILGDNIFYGHQLEKKLITASNSKKSSVFTYRVDDPERYGVIKYENNKPVEIIEKPKIIKSNLAITGLYLYDKEVFEIARSLRPSNRGELEITDINKYYLGKEKLEVVNLERGFAWLDTGTVESLIETSLFIQTIEKRQGLKVSCPEEIVWRKKLIDDEQLNKIIRTMENSPYKQYLSQILNENLINSSD